MGTRPGDKDEGMQYGRRKGEKGRGKQAERGGKGRNRKDSANRMMWPPVIYNCQ